MAETKRRSGLRKAGKKTPSGQRSLLDLFPRKASSIARVNSDTNSEAHDSEGDVDVLLPSGVEIIEIPEPPSSPLTTDVDSVSSDGILEISECSQGSSQPTPSQQPSQSYTSNIPLRAVNSLGIASRTVSLKSIVEGRSRESPIVIDSSPSKPSPSATISRKPVYSIFAPRASHSTSPVTRVKERNLGISNVPYPDRGSQHVRGPQSDFKGPALPLSRRSEGERAATNVMLTSQSPSTHVPLTDEPQDHALSTTPEDLDIASGSPLSINTGQIHNHPMTDDTSGNANGVVDGMTTMDPSAREQYIEGIPLSHRVYPSIKRLFEEDQCQTDRNPEHTTCSHELWTDKWRPRRADEIIGNEDRALYLRAWLLALKLHIETDSPADGAMPGPDDKRGTGKRSKPKPVARGTKRPQILRHVDKRRKRLRLDSEEPSDFDSWVVDDHSDDAPAEFESEDELAFCQRTLSRLQRGSEEAGLEPPCDPSDLSGEAEVDAVPLFSYSTPKFGNQIHNTILLNGPSGCGKTAAVYACAEELGWDVFEVYPGIGERSGAALNRLIGEVGKNHLVKQTQRQQKALFFGNGKATADSEFTNSTQEQVRRNSRRLRRIQSDNELNIEDKTNASVLTPSAATETSFSASPISQSIILIEEVDILYEDDANFWPALINIIKDCRRPVVMTCNDISLVPAKDLPLQAILTFAPCPVPLATSYLQCLSLIEGCPLERSALSRLYDRPNASGEIGPDLFMDPSSQMPDLRNALLQLQFQMIANRPTAHQSGDFFTGESASKSQDDRRYTGLEPPAAEFLRTEGREDLRMIYDMDKCQASLSFVDCYLHQRFSDMLTESATADSRVRDNELGYTILPCITSTSESTLPVNQSFYHQDELIAQEALSEYQNHLGYMRSLPTDLQGCAYSAQEYAAQMVATLEELQVPADVLMSSSSAFLDYDPWVRYMVSVDDAVVAVLKESQATQEGTRRTRNSQKTVEAVRSVPISERSRWTLMRSALCVS